VSIAPAAAAFDKVAEQYDALWSESVIGRQQRTAVWRRLDPLFHPGERILDIGCGTGVDASHFIERGIGVYGIDASKEMLRLARARGVDAHHLAAEALGELAGQFDGAISDFGALNCVADLEGVGRALASLIRIGGYVAICVAGPCCFWETAHYLTRRDFAKAFRRWRPGGREAAIGVHVEYPSARRLAREFRHGFRLTSWYGIGLCVPPSYVEGIPDEGIARLAAVDRWLAHRPVFRSLADHQLSIFQRI
jgi:SAM-dependent methyltransferase